MDAAVAASLGNASGAVGSVGGVWLQHRYQGRREHAKVAADPGLADCTWRRDKMAELGGAMYPLSMFVAYHLEVLEALDAGEFTPLRIAEISAGQSALRKAVKDAHDASKTTSSPGTDNA